MPSRMPLQIRFARLLACLWGGMTAGLADADERVAASGGIRIEHRAALRLPDEAVDGSGQRIAVGGLSGITWLGGDRWAAVMDNSDTFILFDVRLDEEGLPEKVSGMSAVRLPETHDYEDIAPVAGAGGRRIFVCDEDTPAIRGFDLDGRPAGNEIRLPGNLSRRRPNRGLEALAADPDGRHLWTATEEAIVGDGPAATAGEGTVVRITRIDTRGEGARPVQYAYKVDPPHRFIPIAEGTPRTGVSALVALGGGRLLVLERSGGPGIPPFVNSFYLVETASARNVLGVDARLAEQPATFLGKKLLWTGALGVNLEGISAGRSIAAIPAGRVFLGVADNDRMGSPNQLIGFTVVEQPEGGPPGPGRTATSP